MRKRADLNEVVWPLWREELTYLDLLNVAPTELDWDVPEVHSRTSVILVPLYPQWMRKALDQQRERISQMAQEDLERDIAATTAYVKLLQAALDKKTYEAKLKRVTDAGREIERTNLRIEKSTLKRLRKGKGFRQ